MDNVDFGSPALQAMSVPAIIVLVVLAAITMRSMVRGERRMSIARPRRDNESAGDAFRTGGLPTS